MSKKINSYLILDFETGGLPKWNEGNRNPACEIGLLGLNGVTLEEILRYDNVIKPYDKSLISEPGAMKVHGLTPEVCERDGVQLSQVMTDFCLVANETNCYQSKIARPILVGHNPTYDIPFLEELAWRCSIDLSEYISGYYNQKGNFVLHYIDTMIDAKRADGAKDVKFTLTECCNRYANDLVDGHRAMNDVVATSSLFRAFTAKLRNSGSTMQSSDGSGTVRKKFQI